MSDVLRKVIDTELRQPSPAAVAQLAAQLAARAAGKASVVLYYGSTLRDDTLAGVLDFYVLLDEVSAWPGSRLAALANRVLPPNVGYFEGRIDDRPLRAKYAVMSVRQFHAAMSVRALDTTLWARFSQPCACVWSRGEADRDAALDAICQAVITAAQWAAALGPARGTALDYWRALFAQTYRAELRVEKTARSDDLVSRAPARYARLLPAAWTAAGLAFSEDGAQLQPRLGSKARRRVMRRWQRRERCGRPLNVLRLLKAAMTFANGIDYIAWKVERHCGVKLEIAPWQRRFPLLAAPGLYRQLRRRGALR